MLVGYETTEANFPRPQDHRPSSQNEATTLVRLLSQLSPEDQVILSLTYSEGLGVPDTAAVMGIPESRVIQRRHTIEAHLSAALVGGHPTPGLEVH